MGFIEANVASALVHVIVGLMLLGYSQEYYFHLSTTPVLLPRVHVLTESRTSQEQCALEDEDRRGYVKLVSSRELVNIGGDE
jgi:hypothetical protein